MCHRLLVDATVREALEGFSARLQELGWVTALLVGGSLATGDHVVGVSDVDLVALTDDRLTPARVAALADLHRELDAADARGLDLGCQYVDGATVADLAREHPTWTHGALVRRTLSRVTRAELVLHGWAVFGPPPGSLLPAVTPDDVRAAAQAEVTGYWAWASRRPTMWLHPVIADLGLTAMARGRHAMESGTLLTKSQAVERAAAPQWLKAQLLARRHGEAVPSPRLRTGWIAWRDARRTLRRVRRGSPDPTY